MGINIALGYGLGLCIGIPIGMYLEKIGFHFWKRKVALVSGDEQ